MLVQLVILVICHTILADAYKKPHYDVDNYETVGHHFEKFILTHHRQYHNHEKPKRFQAFIENLKEINKLNMEHKLATFDIGQFSDMTEEEKRSFFGLKAKGSDPMGKCATMHDPTTKDAPTAWDWRDHNGVTPIKKQKHCGSCWAFSTTALVESKYMMQGKQLSLSEQQLVDCDAASNGCNGGLPTFALSYIMKQGGQESENDYQYTASQARCKFNVKDVVAKVTNCTGHALSGEGALKELLFKEGPVVIGVYAKPWLQYTTGIYDKCEAEEADHAVLLVGYGTENGDDFWLIKNSWGTSFGEKGYIRIKRGVHCNGIGAKAAYSTVTANVE